MIKINPKIMYVIARVAASVLFIYGCYVSQSDTVKAILYIVCAIYFLIQAQSYGAQAASE